MKSEHAPSFFFTQSSPGEPEDERGCEPTHLMGMFQQKEKRGKAYSEELSNEDVKAVERKKEVAPEEEFCSHLIVHDQKRGHMCHKLQLGLPQVCAQLWEGPRRQSIPLATDQEHVRRNFTLPIGTQA